MALQFAKYEGLGNDFVVVEIVRGMAQGPRQTAQFVTGQTSSSAAGLSSAQVSTLCDRHRGIGADGVLLVDLGRSGAEQPPRMSVINADGSQPEMCGNGLRCVALHLVRRGYAAAGQAFVVETDAGPHRCLVTAAERQSMVEVSMRPASLVPDEIPVRSAGTQPVLDEAFEVGGTTVHLSCVSMGNPHAVTFDELTREARRTLGPLLEKHPRFPNAANIGFARVLGSQRLELAVWERGVGFTEACGTGACACAIAAVETGRAARDEPISVRLPGGMLEIRVAQRSDRISMTGPARHVFDGTFEP